MKESINIENLNFSDIEKLQKDLTQLVQHRISNFFHAIKTDNVSEIKSFIDWGIPQDHPAYYEKWNNLEFTPYTKIETLQVLHDCLSEKYGKAQKVFVSKVFNMLTQTFSQNAQNLNIFNDSEQKITDLFQWVSINYPEQFESRLLENIRNQWGTIAFNAGKHAQLESHVLRNMNRPHKALLKASRAGNKKMMEHFYSPPYLKSMKAVESPEKFFSECLGKAIANANHDAISFWFEKGVDMPDGSKVLAHMVQQSHHCPDYMKSLRCILEHVPVLYGNQALLRAALECNRIDTVTEILDHHYITSEYIEKIPEAIRKRASNDSVEYAQQFFTYWSLALKLDEKPMPQGNKMKL